LGHKIPQAIALSGNSNCYLERTKDQSYDVKYSLRLHAKFRSDLLNGFSVEACLMSGNNQASSHISNINVYKVDDNTFDKTFLMSVSPFLDGQSWVSDIDQSSLTLNELSGKETYYIEATAFRRNKKFNANAYFNHLGCFDSLVRLRRQIEFIQITKADD